MRSTASATPRPTSWLPMSKLAQPIASFHRTIDRVPAFGEVLVMAPDLPIGNEARWRECDQRDLRHPAFAKTHG